MGLALNEISKAYDGGPVLERFSLSLPDRGRYVLLGPSGCGKTTLLRAVAGLEQPDGGSVILPKEARLSYVFQEDRLVPSLTARDNIALALRYGEKANGLLADQWLGRLGLSGQGGKYPSQLSGGMKRRVAIARALAYGGDVLLLDEPFRGLDVELKGQVQEIVLGGRDAGRRLNLLVTHDVEEALALGDKILLLDGPPLRVRDTVSIDIPVPKRGGAEDILIWHRDYILRRLRPDRPEAGIKRGEADREPGDPHTR